MGGTLYFFSECNTIFFFFQEMKVFWAYPTEVKILQFSNLITLRQGHKNLYQLSTRSPTTAWPASRTLSRKFQTRTLHRRPNIPAWQALRKRCLARYIDNSLTSLSTSKFTCAVDVLQCTRRLVKKRGRKKYPPSDTTIKRRCRPAQSTTALLEFRSRFLSVAQSWDPSHFRKIWRVVEWLEGSSQRRWHLDKKRLDLNLACIVSCKIYVKTKVSAGDNSSQSTKATICAVLHKILEQQYLRIKT